MVTKRRVEERIQVEKEDVDVMVRRKVVRNKERRQISRVSLPPQSEVSFRLKWKRKRARKSKQASKMKEGFGMMTGE